MSAANVLMCDQLRSCRGAGVVTTVDGERICGSCHRRRETPRRKSRRKSVRQVAAATGGVQSRSRILGKGVREAPALPVSYDGTPVAPLPVVQTVQCTTCDRGKISQHHWDLGHRRCTRCDPLPLVAVGVHKSIPTILLAEDVTPETVASGRRRP